MSKARQNLFAERSSFARYGVAILAVALTLLIKLLMDPLIVQDTPFRLFLAAVVVAAWFGGLGPGLLATALVVPIVDYLFLEPVGAFTSLDIKALPLGLFVFEGVLISFVVTALLAARHRAEVSAREARRHQESLRESEERFRSLIEGVKDYAIFMLDPAGYVASWNSGAERIKGYRAEEIIGKHFSVFFTLEDLRLGKPEQELKLAATEGRFEEEARRIRMDGSRFWASVSLTALHDENGNLRGFSKVTRDITERKRTDDLIRESEERFRLLVQNSSDVITVIDAEGTIRYVSPAIERTMGYRPEEVIGRSVFGYLLPDDLDRGRGLFAEISSRPGVYPPVEVRVPDKDGLVRYLEVVANNLLDDPTVRGIVVNQRDITDRRLVEETLRESEGRYRTVVRQAAEGIFLVDVETKRILEANTAYRGLLGYSVQEIAGLRLYDVVAHDRESVDRYLRQVLEQRVYYIGERQHRRKDGSLVDVEVSSSVIHYGGREALCIVTHDVTARKQTEEALRRSLDALLALYETGQILSSTLEREQIGSKLLQIVRRVSNPTAAAISLRDDQRELQVWRSIGPNEVLTAARRDLKLATARSEALGTGGYRWSRSQTLDAESAHFVGLFLPLRVRDRIIGVLEVYGSEILLENEQVDTLSSLASQAAIALENARLYEELAERECELHDLVGRMLTSQEEERRRVAYEVHDGLTQVAIAAYQQLQNFADDHPPASAREREDLDEAVDLVQQTVGEARRVIADLRPTALDDLGLAAAVRVQVERLRAEGYSVRYEESLGGKRLPAALETALFRIAQEALTNARKHAGAALLHVTLERSEKTVCLEVRDWGRGFNPNLSTNGGPGERVGLSSMRERAALVGGDLRILSEPGTGTSVAAEIPLPESEWEMDDGG